MGLQEMKPREGLVGSTRCSCLDLHLLSPVPTHRTDQGQWAAEPPLTREVVFDRDTGTFRVPTQEAHIDGHESVTSVPNYPCTGNNSSSMQHQLLWGKILRNSMLVHL